MWMTLLFIKTLNLRGDTGISFSHLSPNAFFFLSFNYKSHIVLSAENIV